MKNMKLILIAGMVMVAGMAFAKPEPNAFLNKPANTHAALMSQLRNDSQVTNRLMRHFGKTRSEMIEYANSLTAGELKQEGVYLVYNCQDDTEEIKARVIFYKKGTKVWLNSAGAPVMKMSCANPMVRGTDDQSAILEPTMPEAEPITATRTVPVSGEGAAAEMESGILQSGLETSPQAAPNAAIPLLATAATTAGATLSPLYLAPLAGLAVASSNRGGGGGTPPVPEPGTMIALGVGALAVAARRRKKS